jgi:acetyl-CoA acetyltransferase
MCGSGLKAIIMAAEGIRAGAAKIAGSMESMSNVPYLYKLPMLDRGITSEMRK